MKPITAVLGFLCGQGLIFADVSQITWIGSSWPSASRTGVIIFIVLLILAGVGIGVSELVRYFRKKNEAERLAWERFDMAALNLGLQNHETEVLKRIIRQARLDDPEGIFRNILSFEIGVAREIESRLSDRDGLLRRSETIAALRDKLGYARLPAGTRLYSSRELSVGQALTISLSADPSSKRFNSKVHDLTELELVLSNPETEEEVGGFSTGTPLFVTLFQLKDAEYSFTTRVVRKEADGRFFSVAHVAEMGRRQLREYVRLECHNEAAFRVVRSESAPEVVKEAKRYKGLLNDIGGGGINLRTVEEFHISDVLLLSFNFLGENFYGIKGKILRILPRTVHGEQVFQNHICFIEMDASAREKIIRFIFKKQREEIQWRT